ncbi:hypothetical protein, partial [Nocardia beijingensis]
MATEVRASTADAPSAPQPQVSSEARPSIRVRGPARVCAAAAYATKEHAVEPMRQLGTQVLVAPRVYA